MASRRIWGWYFFDWASQPYATLLTTFVFAPYMATLLGDGTAAQAAWGFGIGLAGLAIAVLAPFLGALADRGGGRRGWIAGFSLLYVLGAWGLWWARPGDFSLAFVLVSFGIGLIAMEFATIFTNAMLPDLAPRAEIGRISGAGWGFGYAGGVIALAAMLVFFVEGPGGRTLAGLAPAFGLDPGQREGTRAVGPFTAIWYAVFMLPFFLWTREPARPRMPFRDALAGVWPDLRASLAALPRQRSLATFLLASMLYRDALNGIYVFGGIYAAGVLGWPVQMVGIFGILAAVSGAVFAWMGGRADARFGPKPVVIATLALLTLAALATVFVGREHLFGRAMPPGSRLPDAAFIAIGLVIGAAGGALQAASRTMMVHQADPARMTEAFGLYALTGKATAFLAPLAIGLATTAGGSQQIGITPVIALFLLGLALLVWVDPDGHPGPPSPATRPEARP